MDCSDEKKLALLEAESTDRTKDNYTAYLIPIDKVQGESAIVNDDEVATVVVEESKPAPVQAPQKVTPPPYNPAAKKKNIDIKKILIYAIGIIVLALIIFFVGRCSTGWFDDKGGPTPPTGEQTTKGTTPDETVTQKDQEIADETKVSDSETPENTKSDEGLVDTNLADAEAANTEETGVETNDHPNTDALTKIKEQFQATTQKD